MGATPRSALAVVGVPFAGPAQVESDVRAMLQGALSVLQPAGCPLVGGHTSELNEPCLGASNVMCAKRAKKLVSPGCFLVNKEYLTINTQINTQAFRSLAVASQAPSPEWMRSRLVTCWC